MSLFGIAATSCKHFIPNLAFLDPVTYYWFCLTILTGIWELSFILNYKQCINFSRNLIRDKEHVWFNSYTLDNLIPWRLSKIFYSEYGAWADRDYMLRRNYWSRLIEGTHAFLCGLTMLYCMINKTKDDDRKYLILASLSMGSQLMNSILYMGEYFIQTDDLTNMNYDSPNFPTGFLLTKRGFMYVNLFWTIMPSYCIYNLLSN
jgi:hypothetical protein